MVAPKVKLRPYKVGEVLEAALGITHGGSWRSIAVVLERPAE